MARPLIQHGIAQLEKLFFESKTNQKVLKQLEHELQFRQVPRSVALRAEVDAALRDAASTTSPKEIQALGPAVFGSSDGLARLPPVATAQKEEDSIQSPSPPIAHMVGSERQTTGATSSLATNSRTAQAGSTSIESIDEAYKVLHATPGTSWESIEQMRRQLVQRAHPLRLALLNIEERAHLEAELKRVNSAYALLLQQRIDCSFSSRIR